MRNQPCARGMCADQRLLPYACLPQPRIRSRRCLSIAAWPQRHNRAWPNSDVMRGHSPPKADSPKTGMRVSAAKQCWFGRAVIVINGVTRHMRRRNRELARRIPRGALPRATLRIQDRVNRPCMSSQRDIGSPDWRTKARVRRTIRRRCSGVSFVRIQLREWIYSCPPTRTWWAQQHAQPSSHSRTGLAVTMARDEPSVAA